MTNVKSELRAMLEDLSTPHFLVVDDDPNEFLLIKDMLAEFPVEVSSATSVANAISLLVDKEYFVALIDLRMPGGNGAELIEWMHKSDCRTRRAILTGHAGGEAMEQALRFGPIIVMSKPFTLQWFKDLLYLLNLPHVRSDYATA